MRAEGVTAPRPHVRSEPLVPTARLLHAEEVAPLSGDSTATLNLTAYTKTSAQPRFRETCA